MDVVDGATLVIVADELFTVVIAAVEVFGTEVTLELFVELVSIDVTIELAVVETSVVSNDVVDCNDASPFCEFVNR